MFSRSKRYINNHDRIKHTAEKVGGQVGARHHVEHTVASSGIAEELIINVMAVILNSFCHIQNPSRKKTRSEGCFMADFTK